MEGSGKEASDEGQSVKEGEGQSVNEGEGQSSGPVSHTYNFNGAMHGVVLNSGSGGRAEQSNTFKVQDPQDAALSDSMMGMMREMEREREAAREREVRRMKEMEKDMQMDRDRELRRVKERVEELTWRLKGLNQQKARMLEQRFRGEEERSRLAKRVSELGLTGEGKEEEAARRRREWHREMDLQTMKERELEKELEAATLAAEMRLETERLKWLPLQMLTERSTSPAYSPLSFGTTRSPSWMTRRY